MTLFFAQMALASSCYNGSLLSFCNESKVKNLNSYPLNMIIATESDIENLLYIERSILLKMVQLAHPPFSACIKRRIKFEAYHRALT